MTNDIMKAGIKRMLDLSTGHLTEGDHRLLGAGLIQGPRIVSHEYGWIVFVTSEPDSVDRYTKAMLDSGASEAFVDIYRRAAALGPDVMLINFDADADEIDGLPRLYDPLGRAV